MCWSLVLPEGEDDMGHDELKLTGGFKPRRHKAIEPKGRRARPQELPPVL